ncbi:hypothetical protein VQ643_14350 [Pseudomonas sp. F1_0610]|uniref:hypothetical protein n=1 Tax=Pseudomonas sp. F1_0610 TaxID=3114284 RepID=UPI0039C3A385
MPILIPFQQPLTIKLCIDLEELSAWGNLADLDLFWDDHLEPFLTSQLRLFAVQILNSTTYLESTALIYQAKLLVAPPSFDLSQLEKQLAESAFPKCIIRLD